MEKRYQPDIIEQQHYKRWENKKYFKPKGSGKYLKGWYDKSNPKMYVSKGIGTSVIPIRLGARAEMVEILI